MSPGYRPVEQPVVRDGPPRTFTLRRGRLPASSQDALNRSGALLVRVDGRLLDLPALFGRVAPVVLEIGCGMGEATAAAAASEPDRDLLAVDVHTPGLGALLRRVQANGLTNVRVADGDVRLLLSAMLGPATLDEVRLWFPDPWPKSRHADRRLLGPGLLAALAQRLRPGGRLHVATDWPAYAERVERLVTGPDWQPVATPARPATRFEQRGRRAGREPHDLAFRLTDAA